MLGRLESLPGPQQDALAVTFGLRAAARLELARQAEAGKLRVLVAATYPPAEAAAANRALPPATHTARSS
jgi:hypothetical protein